MASPKAVTAGAAELAQRDPPPLVVAALNLKTVLQTKARRRTQLPGDMMLVSRT